MVEEVEDGENWVTFRIWLETASGIRMEFHRHAGQVLDLEGGEEREREGGREERKGGREERSELGCA